VATDPYSARCTAALDEALATVPFYRGWRELDPGPARPVGERMAALPVLSRADLRAHVPHGFVKSGFSARDGFAAGEIEIVTTSGTTADRASVVWHQPWWDSSLREAARVHPALEKVYGGPHREAVLTSPMCTGNLCHVGELPVAQRTLGNLLFLNQETDPARWDEASIRRMTRELDAFRPDIIEADPAYLAVLARACVRSGTPLCQPACIALTYEFPSRLHVREIRRAFPGVPIVSSYGSTETGYVFTECAAGLFHQNTATCHVDVQQVRSSRSTGRLGRVLVTTLGNPWFGLLRFDVGDLVRLHGGGPCRCGRADGLTVAAIEGRVRDLTFDTGGLAVTVKQLDDAMAAADGLLGYRIEQSGPRRYAARYVAEPDAQRTLAETVPALVRAVYGADAEVTARREPTLTPEQSGKYRLAGTTFAWSVEELFA
jgi:phenylacetate-coenzyme A ligase PaaK-like adenylate-forming protein